MSNKKFYFRGGAARARLTAEVAIASLLWDGYSIVNTRNSKLRPYHGLYL